MNENTITKLLNRFKNKGPFHIIDNPAQHLTDLINTSTNLADDLTYWGYATPAQARKIEAQVAA